MRMPNKSAVLDDLMYGKHGARPSSVGAMDPRIHDYERPMTARLPMGGTVATGPAGMAMPEGMAVFGDPGGGQVGMPVEGAPAGAINFMAGGGPAGLAAREEDARSAFMAEARQGVGRRASGMGMHERAAAMEPGRIGAAQGRLDAGRATLDDALALGLRKSAYGDFGSRMETVEDGLDAYGRPRQRTRSVRQSPEEWMEATFNAPRRAGMGAAMQQRQALVETAMGSPNVQMDGSLFMQGGAPGVPGRDFNFSGREAFAPSMVDLTGDGVADGYMQSAGSFTLFPKEQAAGPQANDPRLMEYRGPTARFGNFLMTWQDGKGYVNPQLMNEGVDPSAISSDSLRDLAIVSGKAGRKDYGDLPDIAAKELPSFGSVAEAEAAGLEPGTVVMIGGRRARID